MLHGWENFFATAATAGATLIGLLFVSITVGSGVSTHFEEQHLTADAVGKLAAGAGVKSLVLTHNPMPDNLIPQARVTITKHYDGPVAFAKDLDNY
jgi:ribonuclease BN (tRNA processing enzyme)